MKTLKPNIVPYRIPMPNNMGIVRYLLALAVVVAHFNELAGGRVPFFCSSYAAVGGFFTLSGFLIFGSYLKRSNVVQYIKGRVIRLLPAYWATILLCAIGLVSLSSLSAIDYFSSSQFWKYLAANLSFLNFIEPDLPGVFQSQKVSVVNVSLWTMKVEWMLYLSVPVVAWLIRKTKWRPTTIFIAIYILSVCYRLFFSWLYSETEKEIYNILSRQFFGQMMYFYTGVLIYYYFDAFMRYKWQILLVISALMLFGNYIPYYNIIVHPLAFGSFVIWVSMVGKWGTFESKRDNVSYNMYLTHGPVIQLAVYFGLSGFVGIWWAFVLTLLAIVAVSVAINVFVEKPVQRRYKRQ